MLPCDTVVSRFVRTPRGATAAAVRQATGWRPTSAEVPKYTLVTRDDGLSFCIMMYSKCILKLYGPEN